MKRVFNQIARLTTLRCLLVLTFIGYHSFSLADSPLNRDDEPCKVDLKNPATLSDIISNALMRGLEKPEQDIRRFLERRKTKELNSVDLLTESAKAFNVERGVLEDAVQTFKYVNCPGYKLESFDRTDFNPEFAAHVSLHVTLHELAHSLIREFDLPVLGNEETMADAFATYYLTRYLPDIAYEVLHSRASSWMIEASEVSREKWDVSGEHNSDARRANQLVSLAIAADPEKYASLAAIVGMGEEDIRRSTDYGTEILRSWRRILQPLWMPDDLTSREARVKTDGESPVINMLEEYGFLSTVNDIIQRFDWHSQVTFVLKSGDGRAAWSRSKRSITLHTGYVERFLRQSDITAR